VISEPEIEQLLSASVSELGLPLTERQSRQLASHFSLLLRWNQKTNLTSIRDPGEIAIRHFQESLFVGTLIPEPAGTMIDVGSGAGFPGLPLKVLWPAVNTVLLEPNHKKATFLMEVIRHSELERVLVRPQRLEQYAASGSSPAALITVRGVKISHELLRHGASLLAADGLYVLLIGADDEALLPSDYFDWREPVPIPHSENRVVAVGKRRPH